MTRGIRLGVAAALFAGVAVPASPQTTMPVPPVGRWETLPRLAYKPAYKPRPVWVDRAQAIQAAGTCKFAPDDKGIIRLSIPFVVLLSPDGVVEDAHADAPDCPALATLIEQFGRALGPTLLVPPDGPPPYWRASHFLVGWQE